MASFDSDAAEVASAVAQGEYLLWLGSGISRSVVPDVGALLTKLLRFLQERIDTSDEGCRFTRAVHDIFDVPPIPYEVRDAIDLSEPVEEWPLDDLILRLRPFYSAVLDVWVADEARDFLVWDGIDVRTTYGSKDLDPDAEHLCVAILMLEGLVTSAQTTNWDGLIEAAVKLLAGDRAETILRVVVRQEDFTTPKAWAELVKFHGCAVKAAEDPDQYRHLLIARKSQISGWASNDDYKMMKEHLEHSITSQPILIVGSSAQDQNIHTMLHQARENLARGWPESPPAVVIADIQLSNHHTHTLEAIYGSNYGPHKAEIDGSALLRAYAKSFLLSLVLFTLAEKLCFLISETSGLTLDATDIERLQGDIITLRDRIAEASDDTALTFLHEFIRAVALVLSVFRSGMPPTPDSSLYVPLSVRPISEALADPDFPGGPLGRLAVTMSLISRGIADEGWEVEVGDAATPSKGVLQIARPGCAQSHVFMIRSAAVLSKLEASGHVNMMDPDVLVIHAEQMPDRLTRSPTVHYGRTLERKARELDLETICTQANDSDALFATFRLEGGL